MSLWLKSSKLTFKCFGSPNVIVRCLRNSRRSGEPKLIKGKVETLPQLDPEVQFPIKNYQDFVKKVKSSAFVDDYAIEEAINSPDDFGNAINKAVKPDPDEMMEDKSHRAFIKKKIIEQKYFKKLNKETNLLTYAAKEQIRYLHRMDPAHWNPEALAQSFPISVAGIKKLLKSNYVLQSPEKIKQHDKEVAQLWDHLESGRTSPLITPRTQRMWNEGEIVKVNYNGNPNLPNVPPVSKQTVIYPEEKEIGEYSAIIRQYVEYKKSKEQPEDASTTNDELQVQDLQKNAAKHKMRQGYDGLNRKMFHMDDETFEDDPIESSLTSVRRKKSNDAELPHSQFKDNLKEEVKFKSNPRYADWMEQQFTPKTTNTPVKPVDTNKVFSKISKFKKENMEFKREKGGVVYYYDEKYGYQYPKGRVVPSKIPLSQNQRKKGSVYKVGQSVYGEDGEFLYRVPN